MIKIQKDIPHPKGSGSGIAKYPFGEMQVGDSFSLEGLNAMNVYNSAINYARNHGMKFSKRTVDGVTRIWRIK
jgi:hypothetical protein